MSPLWFDPPPAADEVGTIKDDNYRKVTNKKEIKGYLCHTRPAAFMAGAIRKKTPDDEKILSADSRGADRYGHHCLLRKQQTADS